MFAAEAVARLRTGCEEPSGLGEVVSGTGAFTGPLALTALMFRPDSTGGLKVWEHPVPGEGYVAAVDVGGRSVTADWSVVAVLGMNPPRVVAQWRGHTDHDLLTWKSAAIAAYYNRALLVFESNTLESGSREEAKPPTRGRICSTNFMNIMPTCISARLPKAARRVRDSTPTVQPNR